MVEWQEGRTVCRVKTCATYRQRFSFETAGQRKQRRNPVSHVKRPLRRI